jgi:hypothetical protein
VVRILNMKKYCLIKNGQVTKVGGLPVNFDNVSNFHTLPDDAIKQHGWLPVETISENKEIQESVEYIIEENIVREIITTRDKTQEEIEKENQSEIEAKWHSVRIKRNNLLKESDIEVTSDRWDAMDSNIKLLWINYRNQLRDIPQVYTNPDDIVLPEKP